MIFTALSFLRLYHSYGLFTAYFLYEEVMSINLNVINCYMSPGAQSEMFQGRGGFAESGHFNKFFVKNTIKKVPAGKNFGAFSPGYS